MRTAIKGFFTSDAGAVAPMMALTLFSLIAATGASVDYARAQMVQTKLADTLDAAGLAAGATLSSQNPNDVATNFFNVNFPQGYMSANVSPLTIAEDAPKTKLNLSATAKVPTIFMNLVGINSMDVSAATEITRKAGGLEIAMVMDNTGSMAGSKLTSLKSAANEMIDILFGTDSTKDKLWIGLVPFSQSVNIGTAHPTWIDTAYKNSLNWHNVAWMGCVDARTAGFEETDAPPASQLFKTYYWPDDSNNDWVKSNGQLQSGIGTSKGPNKSCSQQVQLMSNVKATVSAGIGTMQAVGNTHINLGAVWGFRMLSPKWQGQWGGTMDANGLPLAYGTPHMSKAAIIMTDGDNTMDNSNHTAYWYLSNGKLGTTNQAAAQKKLDSNLTTVCNNMKAAGIRIYTILFDVAAGDTNAINLLKDCASEEDFFFNSPTSTELSQAFRTIGDSLSNLRISK